MDIIDFLGAGGGGIVIFYVKLIFGVRFYVSWRIFYVIKLISWGQEVEEGARFLHRWTPRMNVILAKIILVLIRSCFLMLFQNQRFGIRME